MDSEGDGGVGLEMIINDEVIGYQYRGLEVNYVTMENYC